MRLFSAAVLCLVAAPAFAASYPVQGKWGESNSTDKKPVDCGRLRTVDFQGERRFDTGGGVPDFRALTVQTEGQSAWRVTEEFRTGQIKGRSNVVFRVKSDPDRLEIDPQRGATLKLRKCQ
jgi:hypothetical protein